MTAAEVYDLTTQGGATDFGLLIKICENLGPYCLIGGMAVNCYVEPVYTLDADLVIIASNMSELTISLSEHGFRMEEHPHSLNAQTPTSQLRIQFTTDPRYQAFLTRAIEAHVLGIPVKVACLEDVTRGKLWAYSDSTRRFSKRKKDELDLIRLAESYPDLKTLYPPHLLDQINRGQP
jgi:hypothetical protein